MALLRIPRLAGGHMQVQTAYAPGLTFGPSPPGTLNISTRTSPPVCTPRTLQSTPEKSYPIKRRSRRTMVAVHCSSRRFFPGEDML